MGSQQFCLRWNNHQANMLNVFDQLLQSEDFVDVTLACEGLSMKAHKVVLSACSPYFQSLFKENPCKHPIVILKDMKYSELKSIVDFMYKGEINVSQDQLSTLLKTAETLKVKGLAEVSLGAVTPSSVNQQSNHRPEQNGGEIAEMTNDPQTSNGTEVGETLHNVRMSPRRKRRRPSRRSSEDEFVECLNQDLTENLGVLNANIVPKVEPRDFDFEPPVALLMEDNSNNTANNGSVTSKKSRNKSSESSTGTNLKSPLWKHYSIGTEVRHTAICDYCDAVIKRKDGSTNQMGQHLFQFHKEEHAEYLKDAKEKRSLQKTKKPRKSMSTGCSLKMRRKSDRKQK